MSSRFYNICIGVIIFAIVAVIAFTVLAGWQNNEDKTASNSVSTTSSLEDADIYSSDTKTTTKPDTTNTSLSPSDDTTSSTAISEEGKAAIYCATIEVWFDQAEIELAEHLEIIESIDDNANVFTLTEVQFRAIKNYNNTMEKLIREFSKIKPPSALTEEHNNICKAMEKDLAATRLLYTAIRTKSASDFQKAFTLLAESEAAMDAAFLDFKKALDSLGLDSTWMNSDEYPII